jgi:hypothetical protein
MQFRVSRDGWIGGSVRSTLRIYQKELEGRPNPTLSRYSTDPIQEQTVMPNCISTGLEKGLS